MEDSSSFVGPLVLIIALVLGAPLLWLHMRRTAKEQHRVRAQRASEALGVTFDLRTIRKNVATLRELSRVRAAIEKVCIMRNVEITGGGRYGATERQSTLFSCFLVLEGGDTLDLDVRKDHAGLHSDAQTLAAALSIPLDDSSYGG